ncbi:ABC transporter permease [Neobacillus sp. BF23-41]|uniref:ABC transporter permease n=1 Tax=Neobacillus sp. BF23-41 TaxID=3240280 RepID=UPI0034E56A6C
MKVTYSKVTVVTKEKKRFSLSKILLFSVFIPTITWLILFLVLPYINLFIYSFWQAGPINVVKEFSSANYTKFFTAVSGANAPSSILIDTIILAGTVTVFTLLLSYPLAYYINFHVTKYKQFIYMLVIIPLWISYIVRAYSWKIILGTNGILNSSLMYLHIIDKPLEFFLYSKVSVIIGMVHIYTPFVLMPIYTVLEQIPRNLVESSKDLGANRFQTFFKVVFPLSLPGVIAGATFAFVLSMGDFLAPSLLGGPDSNTMIANLVQLQFGTSNNWPYGSAIGVIIFIFVLIVLDLTGRAEKKFSALDSKEER